VVTQFLLVVLMDVMVLLPLLLEGLQVVVQLLCVELVEGFHVLETFLQ
jgi:hypothetical protein